MIFRRSPGVPQLASYRSYKRFLRVDFRYRCCYCEMTEAGWGSSRNFVVEHFRPRVCFPDLVTVYGNLYYSCNRCNDFKGDHWPSAALRKRGYRFADPCIEDIYKRHVREEAGRLTPLTRCGEYTLEHTRLNRVELVVWRRERTLLLREVHESQRLVDELARFNGVPEEIQAKIRSHLDLCTRLLRRYT